jgi:hypothetical protein
MYMPMPSTTLTCQNPFILPDPCTPFTLEIPVFAFDTFQEDCRSIPIGTVLCQEQISTVYRVNEYFTFFFSKGFIIS